MIQLKKVLLFFLFVLAIPAMAQDLSIRIELPGNFKMDTISPGTFELSPVSPALSDGIEISYGPGKEKQWADIRSSSLSIDLSPCDPYEPTLHIYHAQFQKKVQASLSLIMCSIDSNEGICVPVKQDYSINFKKIKGNEVLLVIDEENMPFLR